MKLAIINTRGSSGIYAPPVTVEIHISRGLPGFHIVGLPETSVKESKQRVRSAILNSQFDFPLKKIIINLAPADVPKEGGRFDLPIALGILAASDQIPKELLTSYEFAGELALTGKLRPVSGMLPFAMATRKQNRKLIVPKDNAIIASLPGDNIVYPAGCLIEVCEHLTAQKLINSFVAKSFVQKKDDPLVDLDLNEIYGQQHAKRALEIAAAGGHSLLMLGPPGTGKTMLANRLPGIMPPLTNDEALEVAAIRSIHSKSTDIKNWRQRPFRAPHHTASAVAIAGGGSHPRPGEISLAHHGILFLDELPEFDRKVLEVLREPIESGFITISRAHSQVEFPAKFQLIAAMNPCPCGNSGHPVNECRCSIEHINKYRNRISGPILDRIDMHLEVPALPPGFLSTIDKCKAESSSMVKERVCGAIDIQRQRNEKQNNLLTNKEVKVYCKLCDRGQALIKAAMEKLGISARAYHRVMRVARTIADLSASEQVSFEHLTEALSYRHVEQKTVHIALYSEAVS